MTAFTVTADEIKELVELFEKSHEISVAAALEVYIQHAKPTWPLDKMYGLTERRILDNSIIQNKLFQYFKDKKDFSLAEYYESQLINDYWHSDILQAYTGFIKKGIYYPENPQIIYDSLKKQSIGTVKNFWTMITLASLIKENDIATQSFHLVIDKKGQNNITLLDLEKIKKTWDRRFKNVNIETLPKVEYEYLSNFFSKIEHGKKQDLFFTEEGHYVNLVVNRDSLSQSNKLSVSRNTEALRYFFNSFADYVKKSKYAHDVLSITGFKQTVDANGTLTFYYSDYSKKKVIQSLACDLVDYATTKTEKNNLKGMARIENPEKFFEPFVMSYVLQATLSAENDNSKKAKRSKL